MTIDRIFLIYSALVGIAAAAVLIAVPATGDVAIKPYFWILIAIGVFDVVAFLRGRNAPGTMIAPNTRLFGLLIGGLLMMAITLAAGISVKLL